MYTNKHENVYIVSEDKKASVIHTRVPEDLDGPLLLLASDAGRYMTGATITVDGGHSLAWL